MIKKVIFWFVGIVFVLAIIAFLAFRKLYSPPQITIKNMSSTELSSVILLGDRWDQQVPNIAAGSSVDIVVHPKGESGLSISFVALGKEIKKDDLAYIESSGGYRVIVRIDEKLNVSSIPRLK